MFAGRPLIVTAAVPVPLRTAITQRSSPLPLRLIASVDGSLVATVCVEPALTSAGPSGLAAFSSLTSGSSTESQNVQFQPCAVSEAFQQPGLLPP